MINQTLMHITHHELAQPDQVLVYPSQELAQPKFDTNLTGTHSHMHYTGLV